MARQKILFIITSVKTVKGTNGKDLQIGFWLTEFADPYYVLSPKYDLVFASPQGGPVQPDPTSVQMAAEEPRAVEFLQTRQDVYEHTQKLSSLLGRSGDFAAVYVVGGHGPMFDLASDPTSQALLAEFWAAGKVVAADCAGVGALAHAKLEDGTALVKGRRVTGFSRAEVEALGFEGVVPFMLEEVLDGESGGLYEKSGEGAWMPHVVRDGRLITGQNPASAAGVAEQILEALG